jgi:TonB-dependent Receptor Plug Domain.
MNYENRAIRVAILLAFLTLPGYGQVTTASIVGRVTDRTGAAVPNVTVTATQVDTNFSRSAETNATGFYSIRPLPIGNYKIDVTAPGFKQYSQSGIVLEVDRSARIDPTLEIGEMSQSISVTADAAQVNTTEVSLGRTIQNKDIVNLPLVNRDVYSLLALTPGVDKSTTDNPLGSPTQTTVVNGSGTGTGSVNYFLDGGNNTSGLRNTGNPAPNPDAVQEFRVITNNYGAEYGRFAGGVVDVVTKSGSNEVHGSLFEFLRNDKLNARPYNLSSKSPLRRNQYGGTAGGPVIKNRTFFFGGYSGLRQREITSKLAAVVPTSLERLGDFSASTVKPKDPLTGVLFPGGLIPSTRLDPTAQNILKASIPLANRAGQKLEATQSHPFDTDEYNFKIDQVFEKHQATGSMFRYSGSDTQPLIGNVPWAGRIFTWTQQNFNVGDTWTVTPTIVNQLRATYVRNFGGRVPYPQTSLADFGSNYRVQGTPSLPDINVSGYFALSNAISGPLAGSNYYGLRDVLSWSRGRHSIRAGGDMYLEKTMLDTLLNNYGVFAFDGSKSGNALADFVLGTPARMSQDAPTSKNDNNWYYGFFVQDDFRIHPRLTLNLGLRYDLQLPMTDPLNRKIAYVAGQKSTIVPSAPLGILFPGDQGIPRGIIATDKNNFAPRIGIAWDPRGDGKMSVRAAGGVFYGSISANEWDLSSDHQPFTVRQSFPNVKTLTDPYGNIAGGSPFPYYYSPTSPRFLPNADISAISRDFRSPYTYQMNFSVERQLNKDTVVTAAYVSALSHKNPFQRDINYPIYAPGATTANVNSRRPILPGVLSSIQVVESSMNTAYHGLQVTTERRLAAHFQFKGFYTFSKALDSVDEQSSNVNTGAQDHNRLDLERGRTGSDRRHNFVMSLIWDINYFNGSIRPLRWVLNGWTVSSIVSARSGAPLTITSGTDANLDGYGGDRANLVGNPLLDPNRSRSEVRLNGSTRLPSPRSLYLGRTATRGGTSLTAPA